MKMRKGWTITNPNGTVTIHRLPNGSPVVKRATNKGWIKVRVFILS